MYIFECLIVDWYRYQLLIYTCFTFRQSEDQLRQDRTYSSNPDLDSPALIDTSEQITTTSVVEDCLIRGQLVNTPTHSGFQTVFTLHIVGRSVFSQRHNEQRAKNTIFYFLDSHDLAKIFEPRTFSTFSLSPPQLYRLLETCFPLAIARPTPSHAVLPQKDPQKKSRSAWSW